MSYHATPLGVLILAALQALQGLVLLLPGALLMIVPLVGWIFGLPMVVVGFILLFIAWGIFTMQSWAWIWAFIMNVIGLVVALLHGNLIGVVLSLIIVLYLNQSDIKNRFS